MNSIAEADIIYNCHSFFKSQIKNEMIGAFIYLISHGEREYAKAVKHLMIT